MSYNFVNKPPPGARLDRAHPLSRGLVACYLLNEGAGTRIMDISGKYDGTLTNMVLPWVGHKYGNALNFDGVDDFVDCGSVPLDGNNWTIFISLSKLETGTFDRIVSWGGDGPTVWSPDTNNGVSIVHTGTIDLQSTTPLTNAQTTIAITRSGSVARIFVNGKKVAESASFTATYTQGTFGIGKSISAFPEHTKAVIDLVYAYNRGLSPEEINMLHNTPFIFMKGAYNKEIDFILFVQKRLQLFLLENYNLAGRLQTRVLDTYNIGTRLPINVLEPYSIRQNFKIEILEKYGIRAKISLAVLEKYNITREISLDFTTRYKVGTATAIWLNANDRPIDSLIDDDLIRGTISTEHVLHLWNSKGDSTGLTMTNCRLTARLSNGLYTGGTNEQGQEIVTGKWVEVKSNGISGTGITDDAQTAFTPVGGDPNISGNYLAIGNISPNTARHIHVRVNVPANPATEFSAFPELLISYDMA